MTVFCLLLLCPCGGGSFRSGVQPPTGIRATGMAQFNLQPAQGNGSFDCFLSSAPLPLRGWIVPVGGATPDRHKDDRHGTVQPDRRKEMDLLTVFCLLLLCPCGGGSFRSGVQPPTGIRTTGMAQFNLRPAQGNGSFDCFLSSAPLPPRGWIVPVGGATPDRHKDDRHGTVQPPTGARKWIF